MFQSFLFIGFLITLLGTVYFYFELKNSRQQFSKSKKDTDRKLFELELLSEISEKIGYSLSIKDIAATIASTAQRIFPNSTISFAVIETDHIEVTTMAHEEVGPKYASGAKDSMLAGIYGIDSELKKLSVSQKVAGATGDVTTDSLPLSYFNIPLVLNNRFTGMVSISSKIPQAYQEEDMSMLYKIVNKSSVAMGRLEDVIETEKGKIDSLVKSLSSGEMFFTLEYDSLHLFTINSAALRFLNITEANPDIIQVLSKFRLKPNIIAEMKDVILMKKSTIYRNVEIFEARFNIYLTPVFALDNVRVIGVALTMQDVTREHETQKMREGFTNMMVHELRAPLTAIKGAAELLLQPDTEEEDRVKMRLVIKSASERLLKDIDDMLDTAKIDAGKLAIQKTDGDINSIISKTSEELSYASQDRSILIENHLDSTIPAFAFDPSRIGQVLTNLISNAIKYSQPHTTVDIYSRKKGNFVEIEVKDHGVGIEKEKLELLFKPFSQANLSKRIKGTGLGLYITKAIVSQHDGKVWIDSKVGEGTSVFVTLPLDKVEQVQTPQKALLN